MKKLPYIILGFAVGALLTYYFCPRPEDSEATETAAEKGIEAQEAPALVKPRGVITVKEAIALNDNWTKFRKKAVDSASKKEGRAIDRRSVGWAVKDIRDYLNWAEAESENQGYAMDSIYVYLGVYGKKAPKKKANYTTMFIAPKGHKLTAEASSFPLMSLQVPNIPPLNEGTGSGGYP
ncbi:hypothetical protein [Algibacter mikhailovii]|uniref:Uncharacterized protein n=1 Tax=Algibacter mikhailovii TaxID=425498 RepID=A0A918QSS1_9FLAO|nr:hypothetical protein [Algibacter mikhailovii]GGZ71359.1 hypothetical protein GCM10007028_05790 [Algibacter mikhailovii]